MTIRLNLRRVGALLLCFTALGAIVVASAAARSKHAFVPQTGQYNGSVTVEGGELPAGPLPVKKEEDKYVVGLNFSVGAHCTDGSPVFLPVRVSATVKDKTFKATANAVTGTPIGTSTNVAVKVSGHFTGTSAFTGVANVEASGETESQCTGSASFSFEKG